MNKKSALTIAGGVAAALVAGLVALSINMGILHSARAASGPAPSPIVKTVVENVKVKPHGQSQAAPKTVVIPRPAGSSTQSSGSTGYDDMESEQEFGSGGDD